MYNNKKAEQPIHTTLMDKTKHAENSCMYATMCNNNHDEEK